MVAVRPPALTAASVLVAVAAAGCATADTAPSQVALHYSGGPLSSQTFQNCVPSGTLDYEGPADIHYYYPTGQRTFKFSDDPGSDAPPLQATSRDGQILDVSGTITFTLNTSCEQFTDAAGKTWPGGKLQKFHETLGSQDRAFASEGGEEPGQGWRVLLGKYLKDPADRTVDAQALLFGWAELDSDPTAKTRWEQAVVAGIPELVLSQAGEDFFTINNIVLQKPKIPDTLQTERQNNEAAKLRATTADTDKGAAQNFPGGIQGYLDYQQQLAVNKAIQEGRVQVIPIPQGSPVIVSPQAHQ